MSSSPNIDEDPKEDVAPATARSGSPDAGSDTDAETHAEPDVGADRAIPSAEAQTGRGAGPVRKAPLEIKEIENLEDDALGG